MNTKGNTQQEASNVLMQADEERPLEDPLYPIEFLNAMNETGFKALGDWLSEQHAPQAVVKLLEDLNVLGTWKDEVEHSQGKVGREVNLFLQDTVSSLTLHVAEIGGVFYAPYGSTPKRGEGSH